MTAPTLRDRADAYLRAFPQCADSVWIAGDGRWLYGVWQIGNDYRNASRYYGAFPHGFQRRVDALFPEMACKPVLQAFSGSTPAGMYTTRLDINPDSGAELVGNVYDIAALTRRRFNLVIADPPYTSQDSAKYGTPPLNRGKATAALAQVVKPGGHLVWLDTTWPMHRKSEWHFYGAIQLIRSTNHRVRLVSLFERKAAA